MNGTIDTYAHDRSEADRFIRQRQRDYEQHRALEALDRKLDEALVSLQASVDSVMRDVLRQR